jgi:tetratricopeptide (TPR) repeat protein
MDVLIFEEHSSVLPEFWSLADGEAVLVCLDAHLDLQPVAPQRLQQLQACQSRQQIKALEKPRHLLPDRGYGYSLEDWLYPAHRLGLFSRLVWVVPPHVVVDFSAAVFAHLQTMDGVTGEELASFRVLPGGAFRGMLAQVDITICNYGQLQDLQLAGPVILDIDTDYFIEVPGDRVWADPVEVFGALQALLPQAVLVTLSRSAGSGFLPLRQRYIADYLAALFEGRAADAAHFGRLFGADTGRDAAQGLEQESRLYPDCAATWYLRSLLEPDNAAICAARAEALCPTYRGSVLGLACGYPQRQRDLDGRAYAALEQMLAQASLSPQEAALAQVALGTILCAAGDLDGAVDKYHRCAAQLGPHPGFAMEIARLLIGLGRHGDAAGFLRIALEDDKSRTAASLYLAQICRAGGRLEEALRYAAQAHGAAPAWDEAMRLLADIHARRGDHTAARSISGQLEAQQRQLGALLRM